MSALVVPPVADTTKFRWLADFLRNLLANEVGSFANGYPAVWVEPPQMPAGGKGLHVSIGRHSQRIANNLYQHRVSLVQFDRSDTGLLKLDHAIEKVRACFPLCREVMLPFQENTYPQCNFYISELKTFVNSGIVFDSSSKEFLND